MRNRQPRRMKCLGSFGQRAEHLHDAAQVAARCTLALGTPSATVCQGQKRCAIRCMQQDEASSMRATEDGVTMQAVAASDRRPCVALFTAQLISGVCRRVPQRQRPRLLQDRAVADCSQRPALQAVKVSIVDRQDAGGSSVMPFPDERGFEGDRILRDLRRDCSQRR